MWALPRGGTVSDITHTDPVGRFHPDVPWTVCPDGTEIGDVFANGVFSKPVPPAPTLADRLAALAAERYAQETGGILFQASGAAAPSPVATDRPSQGLMTASYVAAVGGHWVDNTPWKMADGSFVALTSADMQTMALSVMGHVSQCFAWEATLASRLATDLSTDITVGWPPNGAPAA